MKGGRTGREKPHLQGRWLLTVVLISDLSFPLNSASPFANITPGTGFPKCTLGLKFRSWAILQPSWVTGVGDGLWESGSLTSSSDHLDAHWGLSTTHPWGRPRGLFAECIPNAKCRARERNTLVLVFERPNFTYPFKEMSHHYFIFMVFTGCLVYARCFIILMTPSSNKCYTQLPRGKLMLGEVK